MTSIVDAFVDLHNLGAHFLEVPEDSKKSVGKWKDHPLTLNKVKALASKPWRLAVVPGSLGLVIIDVDVHTGETLAPRIKAVEAVLGPPICQIPTPGRGKRKLPGAHLCYRKKDGVVGNSVWKYGEVRADKGYVVAYNLGKVLKAARRVPEVEAVDVSKLPRDNGTNPKEGTRHNTLLKEACDLARQHKLNDETRKELTDKYRNLEKPFPLKEIIETLDSAASYAKEYPIYPRLDNEAMEAAFENLGVECRYNLRSSRAELRHKGKDWEPTNDRTVAKLVTTIAKRFSYSVHRGDAPLKYGRDNWNLNFSALLKDREVDPFLLWIEALPEWDRTERIDKYLIEFFKTGDTAIARWISQFLLLGPIQRGFKPGSKLDEMPVVWGAQGIGKSALLRALLPPDQDSWFCDSLNLTSDTKTRAETLQGRVIVEVSEMTGARQADLENLKTFISQQDDGTVRFAYRHDPETMLRRYILAGTSNNEFMLPNDPTGLRRFVPLKLNDPKHATEPYIAEQREQLWAEALIRYRNGERAGLPFALRAEASRVAERHRSTDEIIEDKIRALPEALEAGASLEWIAEEMGYDKLLSRGDSMRLATALRNLGWTKQRRYVGGERQRLWTKL